MQPFLGLFFFFSMLLATGASLECETCTGPGSDCTGPEVPCDADEDTCVVSFTEASVDKNVQITWKGCESSRVCKSESFTMNMGEGKIRRSSVVCCTGNACESVSAKLPPAVSEPNGMQCPACHSLHLCPTADITYCTGSEDQCFEAFSSAGVGKFTLNTTTKGCTTSGLCSQLKTGNKMFGEVVFDIKKFECRSASRAPPSTGHSLLALSGLLVMKMLF